MDADLSLLREIFKDTRLHIGIGVITQLGLSLDASTLRVQVKLLPEGREVVCVMTWPDTRDVSFPLVNHLVLCGFADGHPEDGHVLRVLTSRDEKIPTLAQSGHAVKYSQVGKKLYLGSDTKVGVGRAGNDQSSPLVLGDVLVNGLTALCNAFLQASQVVQTAMGPGYLDPSVRTAIQQFMTTYLTTASTNINSQIAFTER